jgi:hypothetical protein
MKEAFDDLIGFELEAAAGEFEPPAEEKEKEERAKRRTWDADAMISQANLASWMMNTKKMDIDEMNTDMIEKTYAAALWHFRLAAITGDYKATKSIESFINWMKGVLAKPKPKKAPKPSLGSAAFAVREPRRDDAGPEPTGEEDEDGES